MSATFCSYVKVGLEVDVKRAREACEGGAQFEKASPVEESLKLIKGKRSGDPVASTLKRLKAQATALSS